MANKLGDDFKLYTNTGSWGTPVHVLQNDIGDITFDRAPTNVPIPRRGTAVKRYKTGQGDWRLTVRVNYDPTNSLVQALETHLAAPSTPLYLAIADGVIATTGTNYWKAEWVVLNDPLSAAMDEGAAFDVELGVSADSTNEPAKTTVA
jgi:hypothetical protein